MKLTSTIRIRPDFLYLAPLLNVVFLLMIFFLLTSNLVVRSGTRVDLPVSGSSYKASERAHLVTITSDSPPRILLNNAEIAPGDLTARLLPLKKDSRHVIINADSNAPKGLWTRVVSAIAAAGCEAYDGTRPEGE